jgi:hypothetical protein
MLSGADHLWRMSIRPPRTLALRPDAALDALQHEVMQEKAATLGRLTQAFEQAVADWRAAEADVAAGRGDEARRAASLDDAAEALWSFVVQREACGLRNTEAVLREYGVTAVLSLRIGVARRS